MSEILYTLTKGEKLRQCTSPNMRDKLLGIGYCLRSIHFSQNNIDLVVSYPVVPKCRIN